MCFAALSSAGLEYLLGYLDAADTCWNYAGTLLKTKSDPYTAGTELGPLSASRTVACILMRRSKGGLIICLTTQSPRLRLPRIRIQSGFPDHVLHAGISGPWLRTSAATERKRETLEESR